MFIEYDSKGKILRTHTCARAEHILTDHFVLNYTGVDLLEGSYIDISTKSVKTRPVVPDKPNYRLIRDNLLIASDYTLNQLLLPDSYPKMLPTDKLSIINSVKTYRQSLRDLSFVEPVTFPDQIKISTLSRSL